MRSYSMSLAVPLSNRGADYIHAAYGGDRLKQNQYSMQAGNDATRVIVNPIYKGMGYPAAGINTTSFSGPTRLAEIVAPTPYDIKKIKRRGKKVSIKQGNKNPAYNAGVEYAADQPSTHAQVLALNTRNEAVKKSFDTMQAKAAVHRRASSTNSQQSKDPSVIQNLKQSPTMITDPIQPKFVMAFDKLAVDPAFQGFAETQSRVSPATTIETLVQTPAQMLTSSLTPQQPTASEGVERPTVVDTQQDVVDETMKTQPKAFVSALPFAVPTPPPPPTATDIPTKRKSTDVEKKTITAKKNPAFIPSPELIKSTLMGLKKNPPRAPPPPPTKGSRLATDELLRTQKTRLTNVVQKKTKTPPNELN